MSHEQTITVEMDGDYYNIPTIVKGKKVSNRDAVKYHKQNNSLGKSFKSLKDAEDAAKKRSESFNTILGG